jgi:hypothetical protein
MCLTFHLSAAYIACKASTQDANRMPVFSRRTALGLSAAALMLPALPLRAAKRTVATDGTGTAIDGYDTTAYWQIAASLAGEARHFVNWQSARWLFATQAAANLFAATPDAYAPQFGGHCTRAMSFGTVVNGDPEVWRIYSDKLYLFALPVGAEKFDEGQDDMIAKAQAFWDSLT